MTTRVIVITGGSSGLGLKTAEKLLLQQQQHQQKQQSMRVVLACRSRQKAEEAVALLRRRTQCPEDAITWLELDLARLDSVRRFAAAFLALDIPLHVLVLNAGAVYAKRTLTEDGHEMTFQTNHLGHFLLTHLLLDKLKESSPARIIVVSSGLHQRKKEGIQVPIFEWDNIMGEKSYDSLQFYSKSKLMNIWFAYALSEQLDPQQITVNAMCPGFVPTTSLNRESTLFVRALMYYILPWMSFTRTEDQSATYYLRLINDPDLESVSGKFFQNGQEARSSEESYDKEQMRRLWNMSVEMAGIGTTMDLK